MDIAAAPTSFQKPKVDIKKWILLLYIQWTEICKNNEYDIALVQRLLQHSSAAITQRYIGIEPQRIENAIEGHAQLL